MTRKHLLLGSVLGSLLLSCGQDNNSQLQGNSSSSVIAAKAGCQEGVVALQKADQSVEVTGTWRGARPQSFTVQGKTVTVANDGDWKVNVPSSVGLNLFRTAARLPDGSSVNEICAVYAAAAVVAPKDLAASSVLLALRKSAFDDADASTDQLNSLADLLRIAADSQRVRQLMHDALAAEPKKGEKYNRAFYYRGISYSDPEIKIKLVDGGFELTLRLPNVRIRGVVRRTVGLIRPEHDAVLKIAHIEVKPTFQIRLDGSKQVQVTLKTPIPEPSLGSFETDVDGGLLAELIEEILNGQDASMKGEIASALRTGLEGDLAPVIETYFQNLSLRALPSSRLNLPKLDGSGSTQLNIVNQLGALTIDPDKALLQVATRVDGSSQANESEWLPAAAKDLPPFLTNSPAEQCPVDCADPSPICMVKQARAAQCRTNFTKTSGGAISTTLINQILYRLWKNGNISTPRVEGLDPRIASATFVLSRPPMVTMGANAGDMELGLGPVSLGIQVNGVTFPVVMHAKFRVPLRLDTAGRFLFQPVVLVDHDIDLPPAFAWVEQELNQNLMPWLTTYFNRIFQNLEPVSAPTFTVPSALAAYGVPPNVVIGVNEAKIEQHPHFMLLTGAFGEISRPAPPAPQPEICIEGKQRRQSCTPGFQGYVLAECQNQVWVPVQNLCTRNPGDGPRPEL